MHSFKVIIGAIILIGAIIGGSSIGALSNFLPTDNPLLKNAWRAGLNVIYFAIPTAIELSLRYKQIDF